MLRLFLGLAKGAVIGGAVGYGANHLGLAGWGYLVYGAVGFAVGMLVGRPFWSHMFDKQSTIFTSVLKGIVGVGVGAGLYALTKHALGDPAITLAGEARPLTGLAAVFGAAVGCVYGAWVELDDAPPAKDAGDAKAKPSKPASR